jgi:hypothetical protein
MSTTIDLSLYPQRPEFRKGTVVINNKKPAKLPVMIRNRTSDYTARKGEYRKPEPLSRLHGVLSSDEISARQLQNDGVKVFLSDRTISNMFDAEVPIFDSKIDSVTGEIIKYPRLYADGTPVLVKKRVNIAQLHEYLADLDLGMKNFIISRIPGLPSMIHGKPFGKPFGSEFGSDLSEHEVEIFDRPVDIEYPVKEGKEEVVEEPVMGIPVTIEDIERGPFEHLDRVYHGDIVDIVTEISTSPTGNLNERTAPSAMDRKLAHARDKFMREHKIADAPPGVFAKVWKNVTDGVVEHMGLRIDTLVTHFINNIPGADIKDLDDPDMSEDDRKSLAGEHKKTVFAEVVSSLMGDGWVRPGANILIKRKIGRQIAKKFNERRAGIVLPAEPPAIGHGIKRHYQSVSVLRKNAFVSMERIAPPTRPSNDFFTF